MLAPDQIDYVKKLAAAQAMGQVGIIADQAVVKLLLGVGGELIWFELICHGQIVSIGALTRVQCIAYAVAKEVKGQHGEKDHDAGVGGNVRMLT